MREISDNILRRALAALLAITLTLTMLPVCPALASDESGAGSDQTTATAPKPVDDGTIRILCVGNSWTQRSVKYLCSIAKSAGKKLVIGHAFLDSSSLQEQYFSLLNGGGSYVTNGEIKTVRTSFKYHKYNNSDTYTVRSKSSLKYAIQDEPWDYLVLQNRAPESGVYGVWDKSSSDNADMLLKEDGDGLTQLVHFDINDFVDLIKAQMEPEVAANLKVGLSAVWSYAEGQSAGIADSISGYIRAKRNGKIPHTEADWNELYQQLYQDIQTTIPQVAAHMGSRCDFIVNPGLAFYYAREDTGLSSFGYKLHTSRTDAHPAEGLPCYIASLTYAFGILGISWKDVGYYPSTSVKSYTYNAKGKLVTGTATPTARLAFRALACAWQAQKGSRIGISGFTASPLYSYSSILSETNAPTLNVKAPVFGELEQKVDFKITKRVADEDTDTLEITFKGVGRFSGTSTRRFTLRPDPVKIESLTVGSKKATVKWSAPGKKKATGVQIRCVSKVRKVVWKKAKGKKARKRAKLVKTYKTVKVRSTTTVKSCTRASKKVELPSGCRSIKVKVRAYRLVKGTKYAGKWGEWLEADAA